MAFSSEAFLEQAYAQETSTSRAPFPEGEYEVHIENLEVKPTKNEAYANLFLDVSVDSPEVAQQLNRKDTPFKWRFAILAEIDEHGGLAMGDGQNILIGQLRKALNQNNPANPWRLTDILGNSVLVQVRHEKQKDSDRINERIARITAV